MATWTNGVRAAEKMIQDVEECLQSNGIYFHQVTLYPYRTSGGRSDGVSAVFEHKIGDVRNWICVTIYEHWNSDNICLKFDKWVPSHIQGDKHDVPDVMFKYNQVAEVNYAIQLLLINFFSVEEPQEIYVTSGFQGCIKFDDLDKINWIEDHMMSVIMDWSTPPADEVDE